MDDLVHSEKENNMKKLVLVCLTFAFVASSVNQLDAYPAQARCELTEANAPNVRGLRLGMTTQQVADLFPASTKRRELKDAIEKAKSERGNEVVYLAFDPARDGGGEKFAGVESVLAGVQKGRVADFAISYYGTAWRNIDEWVAKLSEAFKLPSAREWVEGPSENPNKVLRCSGIEIEAANQGGGCSVRIRMESVKGASGHTGSSDENKRREFKP